MEKREEVSDWKGADLTRRPQCVIQPWVARLPLMQQTVLLCALRGPDGIRKNHVAKKLARWLRRCVLVVAFERRAILVPYTPLGEDWRTGSFTGDSCHQVSLLAVPQRDGATAFVPDKSEWASGTCKLEYGSWQEAMWEVLRRYVVATDELPHHYQLHFLHAAEILGYKHADPIARDWWGHAYAALANDMHLNVETELQMDKRLGDREDAWRDAERGMTADA